MGTIVDQAVVAVGYQPDWADAAREFQKYWALDDDIGPLITLTQGAVNGALTVSLVPSGSKIGWDIDNRWREAATELARVARLYDQYGCRLASFMWIVLDDPHHEGPAQQSVYDSEPR